MARHLIMGYYTCNLGHKHSTDKEMGECNRMEEDKQIRDHTVTTQNIENEKIITIAKMKEQATEAVAQIRDHTVTTQNIENERIIAIAKMKEQVIEHEREQMRHEENMKQLELETAKAEKDKKPPKSKVCVLS